MSKFNFGTRDKCIKCDKLVYSDEKLVIDSKILHASCFRCVKCNTKLQPGNYAALDGSDYCKVHFKEAFKLKGRYDFGEKSAEKGWKKDEENKVDATATASQEEHVPQVENTASDGIIVQE
jgi:hypothetical protein